MDFEILGEQELIEEKEETSTIKEHREYTL